MRPSWDETWLEVAKVVAKRSTCPRKQVGAVLVDAHNRVVATGYNGAPSKSPHCCDVGCIIDPATGSCLRAIHAEVNALMQAGERARGCTLYMTLAPCWRCATMIVQAGVRKVVFAEVGEHSDSDHFLESNGVEVIRYGG